MIFSKKRCPLFRITLGCGLAAPFVVAIYSNSVAISFTGAAPELRACGSSGNVRRTHKRFGNHAGQLCRTNQPSFRPCRFGGVRSAKTTADRQTCIRRNRAGLGH
ncbi:MAG: hypothetical protein WBQ55_28515, partial [Xanthobacteraceae bacterium]